MVPGRIGIFDSGVGGLTVAARLLEELPHLSLHYFGDTAHVPYGSRAAEEVAYLVDVIVEYLVDSGACAIVMACNTSTALALESVRSWCPVPVVGIIEPAARAAVSATRNGRIGLIANPHTARSGAYERAAGPAVVPLSGASIHPQVFPMGCPKLVPLVEAGNVTGHEAREALTEYLSPLQEQDIDTLILGCTHFPFLRGLISEILGEQVSIIDPGAYVCAELRRMGLDEKATQPGHVFEVSGSPGEFERVGTRLLGQRLSGVEQVYPRRAERLAV